jgi:formylglycine-generating enzyme required for sulfatase activity
VVSHADELESLTMRRSRVGVLVTVLACLPALAQQGSRLLQGIVPRKQVALVIGNASYANFGQLKNPVNDADAMSRKLGQLNYDVLLVKNAGRRAMAQKVEEFIGRLGSGDVGLFYYAGHGVQVEGENYLVPVDFDGQSEIDVRVDAYAITKVQERMERSGAQLNILVLDACRNNPFRFAGRSGTRGWAAMNAGQGTFIAFATAPGSTASDNLQGDNGLFTKYLLAALSEPGMGLDELFLYVRGKVYEASGKKQLPWTQSSVLGQYRFAVGGPGAAAPAPVVDRRPPPQPSVEPRPAPPQIEFFTANPISIQRGQAITLRWSVAGTVTTSLDQGIGPAPATGDRQVSPATSTTYTLTATGPGGTSTAAARVIVSEPAPPPPPVIETAPPPSAWSVSRGEVRVNPRDGLKYVWIPPGRFTMGCSPGDSECDGDEKPAHPVRITRGFWIGQTEVTQAAYERVMRKNSSRFKAPERPVESVSWDEAKSYCESVGLRLPTEAEWEYAARAGSTEARYGGIESVAWYSGNSSKQTQFVGRKEANGFGLYDMLGNVWEWISDWHEEKYYSGSEMQDPSGPSRGQYRVLRGGSWNNSPRYVRVSLRIRYEPSIRTLYVGVRCAGELR